MANDRYSVIDHVIIISLASGNLSLSVLTILC